MTKTCRQVIPSQLATELNPASSAEPHTICRAIGQALKGPSREGPWRRSHDRDRHSLGEMPTLRRLADGREPGADVVSAAASPVQVPEVSRRRARSATPRADASLHGPGPGRSLTPRSNGSRTRSLCRLRDLASLGAMANVERVLRRGIFQALRRASPNVD